MPSPKTPSRKTVNTELGEVPHITCSPSQINQVLLNLVNNAAQATNDDATGAVTLRTGIGDADQVFIDVEDNGHGIAPEVLPKIFDPFFTTKEVGKGTGLGLSIVYKIIAQHGGRIAVVSKVDVGSRFTVMLPIKAAPDDAPPTTPDRA